MVNSESLSIRPADVADITKQLDELANRVERVMSTEADCLTPAPSARDEVSQRVAATLNTVHGSFVTASEAGVTEMREVAATLRTHNHDVVAADQDFAV